MKASGVAERAEELLKKGDVKPTSNRLLVLRELLTARRPMSLMDIEDAIETMERSSVLRVLTLLTRHDVIHTLEDGRGVTRYEICHGESHCTPADMHAHFYCEKCGRTICFEEIPTPAISIPGGFEIRSVNYMLKGICPECRDNSNPL